MALGIREEGIYTILSIPLDWESSDILSNHFRMLADEIDKSGLSVVSAQLNSPLNSLYDKPCLEILGFSKGNV